MVLAGIRWIRVAGKALIVAAICFLVIGTLLVFAPTYYEATARIKVGTPSSDINSGFGPTLRDDVTLPKQIIQSKVVLFSVISNLNLCHRLTRHGKHATDLTMPQAYSLLRKRLRVQPARAEHCGAGLLEIRVKNADPNQAAAVANAIAESYRHYMLEQWQHAVEGNIRILETELQHLEKNIQVAQATIERLGKKLNLPTNTVPGTPIDTSGIQTSPDRDVIDYWKARGTLESLTVIRDRTWMRIIQEKVDSQLPRGAIAEIIDYAEPPIRPSSHFKILSACAFAAGSTSLALGIVLTRLSRRTPKPSTATAPACIAS